MQGSQPEADPPLAENPYGCTNAFYILFGFLPAPSLWEGPFGCPYFSKFCDTAFLKKVIYGYF